MFDFAREHNLVLLRNWCLNFFPYQMDWRDLAKFIQYLDSQNNPEDEEENKRLMKKAAEVILKDFAEIKHRIGTQAIFKVFEDCLIKSISTDNIVELTNVLFDFFILERKYKGEIVWTNIENAALNFVFTNYQSLKEKGLDQKFSYYFSSYFNVEKSQRESTLAQDGKMSFESKGSEVSQKAINEEAQRKAIKRMEPSGSIDVEEEKEDTGPILKKTKQSIDESRN